MLYLYTRLTWRNLWLWIVPSSAAMYGVVNGSGPLGAFGLFLVWHFGARAFRHYRGLPLLLGALLVAGATGGGPVAEEVSHRARGADTVDSTPETPES